MKNKKKYNLGGFIDKIGGEGAGFNIASNALLSLTMNSLGDLIDASKPETNYRVSKNVNTPIMQMGGTVPVEIEGNEVIETPNGDISQAIGPDHAQGGIDVNLPEGTKVFSEDLGIGGKSMADRKLDRERKMTRLEKALANRPFDTITKGSIKRTANNNAVEENNDMVIQETAAKLNDITSNKLQDGTGPYGVIRKYFDVLNAGKEAGNYLSNYWDDKDYQSTKDQTRVSPQIDSIDPAEMYKGYYRNPNDIVQPLPNKPIAPVQSTGYTYDDQMGIGDPNSPFEDQAFEGKGVAADTGIGMTQGDYIGNLGSGFGAIAPLVTTMFNRAGDEPNVNTFDEFGVDALAANQQSQTYVGGMKDRALQDALLAGNASKRRIAGSTRSLNTQRALNIASDSQLADAQGNVYDAYSQQMMGLLGQQSQLENVQDEAVMTGEHQKNVEDTMDRDNFHTQLAQNFSNISEFMQKAGADKNVTRRNQDILNLLPLMSQYGIGIEFDEEGKPKLTQGNG